MIKQRVKAFLNLKNQRNRLLAKNVAFTSLFQLGSVLMGVILLPISLSLLPAKVYGIWLTVSSMLMWLSYLDLGLGSGLKNKLSEAVALSDFKKAKKLISTAYFTIILIMIAVSLVFFLFSNSINYLKIFGNPDPTSISPKSLNNLINIVAYIFILRFIFQLINPILDSIQKLFWSKLIFFISQLIILGLLVFVKLFANPNIIVLGIIYSLTPVCCLLIGTLIFFWKQKELRPSIYYIDFGLIREIYSIGLRFLLIQLNMLVLFQSSNFIIINYIGSEDVVKYNIAFNLFSMMNIAFSTIASPYWSAYSSAWHQKDYSWITKAQKKLLFIWILIVSISGIVLIFSEYVYLIWIKNQVKIPFSLSLVLFIYMSLFCFGMIYNTFINSTGKILLQTVSLTILTLIYIPSVIYMIEKLHFGLNSIPIGLCLVASYTVIIAPWQSRRILSKTASGIVNR
jgi:O-antigen/teichoic acid export membrane protein